MLMWLGTGGEAIRGPMPSTGRALMSSSLSFESRLSVSVDQEQARCIVRAGDKRKGGRRCWGCSEGEGGSGRGGGLQRLCWTALFLESGPRLDLGCSLQALTRPNGSTGGWGVMSAWCRHGGDQNSDEQFGAFGLSKQRQIGLSCPPNLFAKLACATLRSRL